HLAYRREAPPARDGPRRAALPRQAVPGSRAHAQRVRTARGRTTRGRRFGVVSARKRVVLLTRPGQARERTEAAVAEAGADVAAVLDPGTASEDDVRQAAPDALLVILDPATEQVLQKFDGVL